MTNEGMPRPNARPALALDHVSRVSLREAACCSVAFWPTD
jgi:hypothetical protein